MDINLGNNSKEEIEIAQIEPTSRSRIQFTIVRMKDSEQIYGIDSINY